MKLSLDALKPNARLITLDPCFDFTPAQPSPKLFYPPLRITILTQIPLFQSQAVEVIIIGNQHCQNDAWTNQSVCFLLLDHERPSRLRPPLEFN